MSPTVRKSSKRSAGPAAARRELMAIFRERACVRWPNQTRRGTEGQYYKKGYEARFIVDDAATVRRIRALLRAVGLKPGRAYPKRSQYVQPVYGRAAVEWFVLGPGK